MESDFEKLHESGLFCAKMLVCVCVCVCVCVLLSVCACTRMYLRPLRWSNAVTCMAKLVY